MFEGFQTVTVPVDGAVIHADVSPAQVDPLERWRTWFPRVAGSAIDAGHFLVEEAYGECRPAIAAHLAEAAAIG